MSAPSARRRVRRAIEFPSPPAEFLSRIGGDFEAGSSHVAELQRYSRFAEAGPERVLDLGCGVGRTATVLAREFPRVRYHGLDVERGPIEWCTREITSRCPGFRFTHVDLRNAAYNPDGSLEAETFAFPYEDDAFDLVFGFSLFTHLMPAALEHYLNEIKRVLDDRGRLHATFFVLDQVRKRRLSDSDAEIAKAVMSTEGPAHTAYEIAEWMVLYDEDWLRSVLSAVGLRLRLVNYGSWPEWALGLEDVMGPQDTLVSYVSDVAARSRGA